MDMGGERQSIEARLSEPIPADQVAALVVALARAEFRRLPIRLILDQRDNLVGLVIPRRLLAEVGLRAPPAPTKPRRKNPAPYPTVGSVRLAPLARPDKPDGA